MSTKLSQAEVEKIARLARLGLTEEEKTKFADQLSSILGYVAKLQEVDTKDVLPTSQVTGLTGIYRSDEVEKILNEKRKALLDQAPEREGDLIKTSSVFE